MRGKTNVVAWVVAVVVIILIIVGAWFVRHGLQPPQTSRPAATATTAQPAAPAAVRHPIAEAASTPAPASTAPLPSLADSDGAVARALARLGGDVSVAGLLVDRHIIERIVATIDALPRRGLGNNVLPLRPPAGQFATATVDGQRVIASANVERYAPYMQWVKHADVPALVAWYVRYYPLFQQAYRRLGYPEGYFNDRLVAVINHLLEAPEPQGPFAVVRTDKGYVFADPALENLSVGQKLMVRVGADNEKLIKRKLRAIRTAVTGQHGPDAAASH